MKITFLNVISFYFCETNIWSIRYWESKQKTVRFHVSYSSYIVWTSHQTKAAARRGLFRMTLAWLKSWRCSNKIVE